MVSNCVAFGCSNEHDARRQISFHVFPFKRPEILKLWIKAIRRKNWYPSRTSRLCSVHFLNTDYQPKLGSTAKFLKYNAVPSVFVFPKRLLKNTVAPRNVIRKIASESEENVMDINFGDSKSQLNLPSTSQEKPVQYFLNAETQTTETTIENSVVSEENVMDINFSNSKSQLNLPSTSKGKPVQYFLNAETQTTETILENTIEPEENVMDINFSNSKSQLNLPSASQETTVRYFLNAETQTTETTLENTIEPEENVMDINFSHSESQLNLPSTSQETTVQYFLNAETQTTETNHENTIINLRRKVKSLEQKIMRRDLRIASLQTDLVNTLIEKRAVLNESIKNCLETNKIMAPINS